MVTIIVQSSKKQVLKENASDGVNCPYHICALRIGVLSGLCDALLIILVNLVRGWRNETSRQVQPSWTLQYWPRNECGISHTDADPRVGGKATGSQVVCMPGKDREAEAPETMLPE